MAQRRSKNRFSFRKPSGSSGGSGILDENTNKFDDGNPLWFKESVIRDSTSFSAVRRNTSILNSDTSEENTALSENWYKRLTRSDNSNLIREAAKKSELGRSNKDDDGKPTEQDSRSESETEEEPLSQRRRANFKASQSKNKSDVIDAFSKALDKSLDSQTKNVNNSRVVSSSDSEESTFEKSRTKIIPRSKILRNKKSNKNNNNKFDDAIESNSTGSNLDISKSSSRTGKINASISSSKTKRNPVKIIEDKLLKNADAKSNLNTSMNKTIKRKAMEKNQDVNEDDNDDSPSILQSVKKKKAKLFSKGKRTAVTNVFDDILRTSSDEESIQKQLTEEDLVDNQQEENAEKINGENLIDKVLTNSNDEESTQKELTEEEPMEYQQEENTVKSNREKSIDTVLTNYVDEELTKQKDFTEDESEEDQQEKDTVENNGENIDMEDDIESDDSSIPKNIRRTRTKSMFVETRQMFKANRTKDSPEETAEKQNATVGTSTSEDQNENSEDYQDHCSPVLSKIRSKGSKSLQKSLSKESKSHMSKSQNRSQRLNESLASIEALRNEYIDKENEKNDIPGDNIAENQQSKIASRSLKKLSKSKINKSSNEVSNETLATSKKTTKLNHSKQDVTLNASIGSHSKQQRVEITGENRINMGSKTHESQKHLNHEHSKTQSGEYLSDDILSTNEPAQSTLIHYGKPLSRLSQFPFRPSIIPKSPIADSSFPSGKEYQKNKSEQQLKQANDINTEKSNTNTEAPGDNENVEEQPLVNFAEQPDELVQQNYIQEDEARANKSIRSNNKLNSTKSNLDESKILKAKEKTNAFLILMKNHMKKESKIEEEEKLKKKLTDERLRKIEKQQQTEKKKEKKPLDKAYYYKGKPYKQPRLPKTEKWVTTRLYKYVQQALEPQFGCRARLRSEEFVAKLVEVARVVKKYKNYSKYKSDVESLIQEMAELKMIVDRDDFYRWVTDYMPASFRLKVKPQLIGVNEVNIPINLDNLYEPIIQCAEDGSEDSSSSGSEN